MIKRITGRLIRFCCPGALLCLLSAFCGCQTAAYYKQAVSGELQLLSRRRPIETLLADPQLDPALRKKFELTLQARDFAAAELKLHPDGHYLTYTDLQRTHAIWNVHAAPEFSLHAKTWWYPLVGRLKYRGYFAREDALKYAGKLAERHLDVFVEGVDAYSTLGWFKDPILNTFIHYSETEFAGTIFHELAHQRVFAAGDTDFNEAFAMSVEQEGVRRWLKKYRDADAFIHYSETEFAGTIFHELAHQRVFAAGDTDFNEAFAMSVEQEGVRRWLKKYRDADAFIHYSETEFAGTIFHELAHQRVFAAGDTDFNEAFAMSVEQEGVRRWLKKYRDADALKNYERELERNGEFAALLRATREKLKLIYGDSDDDRPRVARGTQVSDADKREQKKAVLEALQHDYAEMKARWQGDGSYDNWFARPVNNAQLNTVATYHDLLPAFEGLLRSTSRSEERRVGKECRSRWSPY